MEEVRTFNYEGQTIFVGLDVHKKDWKVSIHFEDIAHKRFTMAPEPEKLVHYLHKNFPGAIYQTVYEAGFSGFSVYRNLNALGVDCRVVHPGDVATTDKERRGKTDVRDANKLARELRSGTLTSITVPDETREQDRALLRQRKAVQKELNRIKQRIKSHLAFKGIRLPTELDKPSWPIRMFDWLEELSDRSEDMVLSSLLRQLRSNKEELKQMNVLVLALSRTPRYQDEVRYISSLRGIGALSALTFLCETGDINNYPDMDHLCGYVGLVPSCHSSGEKERKGRLNHRGNKIVRTMLIECAWQAVQRDPQLHLDYCQYCKRMDKDKAIIRIAKKLLSRIRYVLIHRGEFAYRYLT